MRLIGQIDVEKLIDYLVNAYIWIQDIAWIPYS
jgi:hypothetical protein